MELAVVIEADFMHKEIAIPFTENCKKCVFHENETECRGAMEQEGNRCQYGGMGYYSLVGRRT